MSMRTMITTAVMVTAGWMVPPSEGKRLEPDPEQGLQTALNLQQAFASVAEKASPAVVVITNKQAQRMPDYSQLPPEFRFFFGIPEQNPQEPRSRVPRAAGRGSGVIIRPEGYIVTNYHVIKGHDELEVRLHDDTVFDNSTDALSVEVVGVDSETDLAVLRIGGGKKDNLPYLRLSSSEDVRVGDWAIAVGAPFNLDYSLTVGVVSQKGRHGVRLHTYENYIQTDASINPGNSGGPLLNIRGEVIGINNFIVTGGGMSQGNVGIGFSIASSLVKQVVDDIVAGGKVVRPWLGIAMQALTPELKDQFGVDRGVVVSDVVEGDPADQAGIKPGDVILKVGDEEVQTPHDLQFAVLGYDPGETIPVVLSRNGKSMTIEVEAGKRASGETAMGGGADVLEEIGLQLGTTEDGDVVVASVAPGGIAAAAGLQKGDVIVEVNRVEVNSVPDVSGTLAKTQRGVAVLYVKRNNAKFFVPLRLQD